MLRKKGIDYIDLLTIFLKMGDPNKFYFKKDGHWNELAHRIGAEVIKSYIVEKILFQSVKR